MSFQLSKVNHVCKAADVELSGWKKLNADMAVVITETTDPLS